MPRGRLVVEVCKYRCGPDKLLFVALCGTGIRAQIMITDYPTPVVDLGSPTNYENDSHSHTFFFSQSACAYMILILIPRLGFCENAVKFLLTCLEFIWAERSRICWKLVEAPMMRSLKLFAWGDRCVGPVLRLKWLRCRWFLMTWCSKMDCISSSPFTLESSCILMAAHFWLRHFLGPSQKSMLHFLWIAPSLCMAIQYCCYVSTPRCFCCQVQDSLQFDCAETC